MNSVSVKKSKGTVKRQAASASSASRMISACLKSLTFTAVFATAALLLAAAAVYSDEDPDKLLIPAAHGILAASSFLCGMLACRFNPENGMLSSVISGAGMMLIAALLSAMIPSANTSASGLLSALSRLSVPAVAALGGIAGRGITKSRRAKRKHRVKKR